MAGTNLLAPNGLSFLRNSLVGANTFQQNLFYIKDGYGTNIGVGDLVKTGTGANQGYVVLAASTDTGSLSMATRDPCWPSRRAAGIVKNPVPQPISSTV